MPILKAQFDGKAFVPCEPVDLPAGTLVEVSIPGPPRQRTPEEELKWKEILEEIRAGEPRFPTVDEAIRYKKTAPILLDCYR